MLCIELHEILGLKLRYKIRINLLTVIKKIIFHKKFGFVLKKMFVQYRKF